MTFLGGLVLGFVLGVVAMLGLAYAGVIWDLSHE